jgi:hypothetical protein
VEKTGGQKSRATVPLKINAMALYDQINFPAFLRLQKMALRR